MLSYHDSNYERQFNTNEFYNDINKMVSDKLKRPLQTGEKDQVITFIRKLDPKLLKPVYKSKTIPIMVETLVNEFLSYKCDEPLYDNMKPILKASIGKTSESGTTHGIYDNPNYGINLTKTETKTEIPQPIRKPPKIEHRKNYMILDSRYRESTQQSQPSILEFSWNYVQKNQNTIQGSVNVIGNVRDIVGFRIFPFRIPYVAIADNNYSRISMLIKELSTQAFIAHENRKFHFMLRSAVDNEFIDLETDKFNDGYFWFEKPITTLDTLTITFGNPIEQITFDNDRDVCRIDYFVIAPATQITTDNPHNLVNGNLVYFESFDVGVINPILTNQVKINNDIKNLINRSSGHQVTVINPTTFSIPAVTNSIQNPIPNIQFNVFYGSKRIFIPMEIIYIKPESGDSSH